MSRIKSYSVGDGDTFYIDHNSDNFTIIDCCLDDDTKHSILDEISDLSANKGVTRFISTHPDEDHIQGLVDLDDKIGILNFYCVKNDTTKEDESDSFRRYRKLHYSDKAFYIYKGCSRRWMNLNSEERGNSGIDILWPDRNNGHFKNALQDAAKGKSPNNISPIIKYSLQNGVTALWMGDLETNFMEAIKYDVQLPKVDILFAPHHGRDSGKIPKTMLDALHPRIVVIGEAPSSHLNYYQGYNTITQNSAGDIVFECLERKVHIFTSKYYKVDFLYNESFCHLSGFYYLGTLNLP
ncbi:MAG: hypothetical protein OXH81_08795 [Gemmatimonadetes bacterium]|nr:hypothetical protein [Gemmatimonadota bacterium]